MLQLVPGVDPLGELSRRIPQLEPVVSAVRRTGKPGAPGTEDAVRAAFAAWAASGREAGSGSGSAARSGSGPEPEPEPPAARPVVIVDQFEETFTLCPDESERRAFIALLQAACVPGGPGEAAPVLVVLGIRADFYEHCLAIPSWPTRSSTGTWCSGR